MLPLLADSQQKMLHVLSPCGDEGRRPQSRREPLDRGREQGRGAAVGMSGCMGAADGGSGQRAFEESDDVGQDTAEGTRQPNLRAT